MENALSSIFILLAVSLIVTVVTSSKTDGKFVKEPYYDKVEYILLYEAAFFIIGYVFTFFEIGKDINILVPIVIAGANYLVSSGCLALSYPVSHNVVTCKWLYFTIKTLVTLLIVYILILYLKETDRVCTVIAC